MLKPVRNLIFFFLIVGLQKCREKKKKAIIGKSSIFLLCISSGLDSSEYKSKMSSIHFAGSDYKLTLKSKNLLPTLQYQTRYIRKIHLATS